MPDRFLERETANAIDRVRRELATAFTAFGPVVEVFCAVAGNRAAVSHGLGRVPDGYLVVLELGGQVLGVDVTQWTTELAFVVSTQNNTRARLTFVVAQEVRNA
jgi:hypothetical protein